MACLKDAIHNQILNVIQLNGVIALLCTIYKPRDCSLFELVLSPERQALSYPAQELKSKLCKTTLDLLIIELQEKQGLESRV